MSLSAKMNSFLFREINASTLGFFRIMMGIFMLDDFSNFHIYFSVDLVHSDFFFTYDGFHWIKMLPASLLDLSFYLYYVCCIGFILGIHYRLNSIILFLGYSHIFLVDRGHYNNHYYMFSMLFLFFSICNAHHWGAIKTSAKKTIPYWQLFIFRLQIFVVYFFGGIAKIQGDWLSGFPMRFWLYDSAHRLPEVATPFLQAPIGAYFFSYMGLLFDLTVGLFLLSSRTRRLVLLAIVPFHCMNHLLWDIGSFPFVMLSGTVLFFPPDSVEKGVNHLKQLPRWIVIAFGTSFVLFLMTFYFKFVPNFSKVAFAVTVIIFFVGIVSPKVFLGWLFNIKAQDKKTEEVAILNSPRKQWVIGFISIWFLIQFLFPLRHWLYKGNPSWTGECHFFSWRMMLVGTVDAIKMKVINPENQQEFYIDFTQYLTWRQFRKTMRTPKSMLRFAHYIADQAEQGGMKDPIVKMEMWKSVNERTPLLLNDTTLNYAKVPYSSVKPVDWMTEWSPEDEAPTFDLDKYKAWRGFLNEQDSIGALQGLSAE